MILATTGAMRKNVRAIVAASMMNANALTNVNLMMTDTAMPMTPKHTGIVQKTAMTA